MNLIKIINKLALQQDLTHQEMSEAMHQLMQGQATDTQIGAFLVALSIKGETETELQAACETMLEFVTPVDVKVEHLIDIVGTGGDNMSTFNVSTASSVVVAAAGGKVAKHGNRSVSSKSGSADVLEKAGLNLNLTPQQIKQCIEKIGLGFMFAPAHHGAMKHVIKQRRELKMRTIFNLLGPLSNPAHTPNMMIGVYAKKWLTPFAQVCQKLGKKHVLIVHSEDGLDEISCAAPTYIAELKDNQIVEYTITPEQFAIPRSSLDDICVGDAIQSLELIESVFANNDSSAKDIVTLNSGAAIYCCGLAQSIDAGIKIAKKVIEDGSANKKWQALIAFSKEINHEHA